MFTVCLLFLHGKRPAYMLKAMYTLSFGALLKLFGIEIVENYSIQV